MMINGTLVTASEIEEMQKPEPKLWRPWKLFKRTAELGYPAYGPNSYYRIDLERIHTQAHVIDWLGHLAEKRWAENDPRCLSGLVMFFSEMISMQSWSHHPHDWLVWSKTHHCFIRKNAK
jgi:hypothetical protein